MKRLNEIRARLAELKPEIVELSEKDEPTEDEVRSLDEKLVEFEALETEAKPLEDRETRAAAIGAKAIAEPKIVVSGDGTKREPVIGTRDSNPYDLSELRNIAPEKQANELRARAEQAIEKFPRTTTDDERESALRLASQNAKVAEHILRTGSPAYLSAFDKVIRNPVMGVSLLDAEERDAMRAAMSTTDANGGYLIPPHLDPTVILVNAGRSNPFRQLATIKSITGENWTGVTSSGMSAEWLTEASEATDASPTFAQPVIPVHKAAAYASASFEVEQDTNVSSELAVLFADARDALELTAFTTGSGSGQPTGLITELDLVTASRVNSNTNGAYGAVDVYSVDTSLSPRYRTSAAAWMASRGILNLTRQFATGSGPQHSFWSDFGGGMPAQLIGYNVHENSAMTGSLSSATASNDSVLILGDFKGYYIVDRIGMSLKFNPLVIGTNHRPTGQMGWFVHWRVGAECVVPDAFRLLRV